MAVPVRPGRPTWRSTAAASAAEAGAASSAVVGAILPQPVSETARGTQACATWLASYVPVST